MSNVEFESDYVGGLAESELSLFDKRATRLIDNINSDSVDYSAINKELSEFFKIAGLFVIAEQERQRLDPFRDIITKVNLAIVVRTKENKRIKQAIDIPLTKQMFLVAALAQKAPSLVGGRSCKTRRRTAKIGKRSCSTSIMDQGRKGNNGKLCHAGLGRGFNTEFAQNARNGC